jgi:biopolymer transport protein ExbB/TolQ
MFVLSLLAIVILVLAVKKTIELFGRGSAASDSSKRGLDAILFWGGMSAVLGLLGQFSGYYLSLQVIASAEIVNPALVAEGIAVAQIPTVYGLAILAVSGVIWFALRSHVDRLARG